jgi:hypothetical protein
LPGRLTAGLIALILLMATHGAVGYQQATVVVGVSILLAGGLSLWWLLGSDFKVQTTQLAVVGVILALMLAPAVVSLASMGSKTGATFLVSNLVAFVLFSQVICRYGEHAYDTIAAGLLLAAVISVALAAWLLIHPLEIGGLTFGRDGYFRPVGTFSTPNRFAEATAVGVLASLYLFLRHPTRRFRYGAAGAILALATVASGSKGVMLGLAAALPVFLLFSGLLRTPTFWRAAVALVPVVAVAMFQIWDYLVVAAKLDLIQGGALDVASGRPEIWAAGLRLFESGPVLNQIFGHGATFFVSATGRDPHSAYLNLLLDYGLISLLWIPILLTYVAVLVVRPEHLTHARILGVSLVVFCLVRGIAMSTIFTTFNFAMLAFWAGLAMLVEPVANRSVAAHG